MLILDVHYSGLISQNKFNNKFDKTKLPLTFIQSLQIVIFSFY